MSQRESRPLLPRQRDDGPVAPPLGVEQFTLTCSRTVNGKLDASQVLCGKPAVAHVIWDADQCDNSFVCVEHRKEVGTKWACFLIHDVVPECGMPGSEIHFERNTCMYPDDELPVAEPVRAIAQEIPA